MCIRDSINIEGCVRGVNEDEVRIIATVPKLRSLGVSGSAIIETASVFNNVEKLDMRVSGSGDINLDLGRNVGAVSSSVSGSGDIYLRGAGESHSVRISGSGRIECLDFKSKKCDIAVSGSGNCRVFVENELNVGVSGSGDVCYQGNPAVNSRVSGSGDVRACQ